MRDLRAQSYTSQSELDYLWVFGVGRLGTTAVQNLLNSIPGVLVRGENNGAINKLVESAQAV